MKAALMSFLIIVSLPLASLAQSDIRLADSANSKNRFMYYAESRAFFKELMQVCDKGAYNAGINDCNQWINGSNMIILSTVKDSAERFTVRFQSSPAPTESFLENRTLSMISSPINNSQGYELRGYGILGTNSEKKLVQIIVSDAKPYSHHQFILKYGGQEIGIGYLNAIH